MYSARVDNIVDQMYNNDPFSQWLGIDLIGVHLGYCKLTMVVRKEMLNGFGIAHGGITFSLADSAFAFASNSHGYHAVSIECSINHLKEVKEGDVLYAEATEKSRSKRLGIYGVNVTNQDGILVAIFSGMVLIKETEWPINT